MDETHGGTGLVDVLSACTGGAVDLHFDILRPDIDVFGIIRDFRNDLDRREGRLAAGVCVERGHAHEAVDAVLTLEHAVGVLSLDENAGGFDARLVTVEIVENLIGQTVLLGPVRVHPVEH